MYKQRWLIVLMAAVVLATSACGGAADRKAKYLQKGEKYFADLNYEKARVEFRNALQIDPTDANARYQLGRVSERLSNPREAAGHYQAAVDADPKNLLARAALARLFLLGGVSDKAMELAEAGLTQDPNNAQLLTVRGAAKSQLRDVPGAFEDAEAAVKLAPDDEYAIALLASLYRQNARSDKAIEVVQAGLEKRPESVDLRVVLADLELAHERLPEAEAQLKKVIELQPKELSHRYRLARFHLLTKNVDGAIAAMREAIDVAPDSIEAKNGLIDLLASQRGVADAETQLKAFVAKDADNTALKLALARFYEGHANADQAQDVYRDLIKSAGTKPDGLTARNRLAAMLVQRNDIAGATPLINEVLKENPRDNDALILRGNLALARGDSAAAIADLRAVLRDQPNAVPVMRALARAHLQNSEMALAEETLRSAIQTNPTDRPARLELAQVLSQSGRAEQARPLLEQLVSETPTDVSSLESLFRVQASLQDLAAARSTAEAIKRVRPDMPLGPYLEGTIDEAEGKLDAAAAAYEKALAIQPNAGEPLTAVVRVDLARKQSAQALARLEKVIAAQPDNVIAGNLKGELLTSRGEIEPAIAAFNEAITKAPKWWMPYRSLALAQLAAKRTDAAVETLERGMKSSGGSEPLGADLASLYERLGRTEDAIRTYEAVVAANPASVAATNNLAMLLVSYRSDRPSLDRAQQLSGKLANVTAPAVLNTRGWVKFKRGEYQESLPLLQQAVDKVPDSPVMRYHLAMAQLRTGDRSGARENLEAALKSGSNFVGSKEAKSALDEIKGSG